MNDNESKRVPEELNDAELDFVAGGVWNPGVTGFGTTCECCWDSAKTDVKQYITRNGAKFLCPDCAKRMGALR